MIAPDDLTNRATLAASETAATRQCKSCYRTFTITGSELAALEAIAAQAGWPEVRMPSRCTACRKSRREAPNITQNDGQDEWLICVDCGDTFVFGGRDKSYWARCGWPKPKRCRTCRTARRR